MANLAKSSKVAHLLHLLREGRELHKLGVSDEGGEGSDKQIKGGICLSRDTHSSTLLMLVEGELELVLLDTFILEQLFLKASKLMVLLLNFFHQHEHFLLLFAPLFRQKARIYLIITFLHFLPQPKSFVNLCTHKFFLHRGAN